MPGVLPALAKLTSPTAWPRQHPDTSQLTCVNKSSCPCTLCNYPLFGPAGGKLHEDSTVEQLFGCGHQFHQLCLIDNLFNDTELRTVCPTCLEPISDGEMNLMRTRYYQVKEQIKRVPITEKKSEFGRTLLMDAAAAGDATKVKTLLADGSTDVNLKTDDADGDTALVLACTVPLGEHEGSGRANVVKQLLDAGADANLTNNAGKTPLIAACRRNAPKIVTLLLAQNPNIEAADIDERTPLMHACRYGALENVNLLLTNGAQVNKGDAEGTSSLMFAAKYGFVVIVDRLLKVCDIDVTHTNKTGWTAAMVARGARRGEIVKLLEDHDKPAYDHRPRRRLLSAISADVGDAVAATVVVAPVPSSHLDDVVVYEIGTIDPDTLATRGYTCQYGYVADYATDAIDTVWTCLDAAQIQASQPVDAKLMWLGTDVKCGNAITDHLLDYRTFAGGQLIGVRTFETVAENENMLRLKVAAPWPNMVVEDGANALSLENLQLDDAPIVGEHDKITVDKRALLADVTNTLVAARVGAHVPIIAAGPTPDGSLFVLQLGTRMTLHDALQPDALNALAQTHAVTDATILEELLHGTVRAVRALAETHMMTTQLDPTSMAVVSIEPSDDDTSGNGLDARVQFTELSSDTTQPVAFNPDFCASFMLGIMSQTLESAMPEKLQPAMAKLARRVFDLETCATTIAAAAAETASLGLERWWKHDAPAKHIASDATALTTPAALASMLDAPTPLTTIGRLRAAIANANATGAAVAAWQLTDGSVQQRLDATRNAPALRSKNVSMPTSRQTRALLFSHALHACVLDTIAPDDPDAYDNALSLLVDCLR